MTSLLKFFIFAISVIFLTDASALNGACQSDSDCGTIDTICQSNRSVCVCRENFTNWADACVELTSPVQKCTNRQKCQRQLGPKTMCTNNWCTCKEFHHFYQGICVKNRDLHEKCDQNHQCYCGSNCQLSMECAEGHCACKTGFRANNRRCIKNNGTIIKKNDVNMMINIIIIFVSTILVNVHQIY